MNHISFRKWGGEVVSVCVFVGEGGSGYTICVCFLIVFLKSFLKNSLYVRHASSFKSCRAHEIISRPYYILHVHVYRAHDIISIQMHYTFHNLVITWTSILDVTA